MKKTILIFVIFFATTINILAQVIITNNNNPTNQISTAQLRNIYIGNKISWDDGSLIHLADYSADSKIRKEFCDEFLNLSPRKVSMLWIKVSLSGKSVPPQIFRDEKELIDYIKNNDRAIGYISSAYDLPPDIKVLKIN
jgi:ABC-type phosphate transport system substrate-binding protein